jgi:4-amino-4-deoxy-L-arabinose transferase-like glycosyltransferase
MNAVQKPMANLKLGLASWRNVRLGWETFALGAILLLSAGLNFYNLDASYYTNEYYAAAVRSMTVNWHNFFFNSFDPGGYITVDKPPVAFWFQALSARLFGFNGISILLPSILAGIAGVALLYHMVKRVFGTVAGLFAALALAVTPIFVVMNRHNNPESLLILALLIAAWALQRALEKGHLGWLLFSVSMVGVGFNIKMLQAFIVLPAFYLAYFLLAKTAWWKRIVHLTAATIVLAAVSLSWALAVDLIPADSRPYVGGSTNNSVINLIIEYNGVGRIEGGMGNPGMGGQRPGGTGTMQPPAGAQTMPFPGGQTGAQTQPFPGGQADGRTRPDGNVFGGGPGGGRGGIVAGQVGPTRMFEAGLAGEAGWLLPLALLSILIVGIQSWRRFPAGDERAQRQRALIMWGGWLVTYMVVFSMAEGIFHSYYLVMLAPAAAALAGASLEGLWYSYRRGGWQMWLLPAALIASVIFQMYILSGYTDWNRTLALGVAGIEVIVTALLLVGGKLFGTRWERGSVYVAAVGMLSLLAAPLAWTINSLLTKTYSNATLPTSLPVSGNSRATSSNLLSTLGASWNGGLTALVVGLAMLAVLALALRFVGRQMQHHSKLDRALAGVAATLLIVFGISLSLTALPPVANAGTSSSTPPSVGMIGNPNIGVGNNEKLISYLEANRAGYTYLLATASSQNASPIIIKTGQPVMALGGFMGSDPATNATEIARMVNDGTVRYFLLDGGGFGRGGSSQVSSWVTANCQVVDSQLWSSGTTATTGNTFGGRGTGTLYVCSPKS